MPELTEELREFARKGFHNAICHYAEVIREGEKAGRARRVYLPEYKSAKCMCHTMTLKYNGEVI